MSLESLAKPLLDLTLFKGLRPLQITEIARCASRIIYQPGDTIIADEAIGDAAIVIISGEAVRVSGPSMGEPAERVQAGSIVGEMAMLIETYHSSTVVARTSVRALRIAREDLHEVMVSDPTIAEHFALQITKRLTAVANDLQRIDNALSQAASQNYLPARGTPPRAITALPAVH